VCFTLRKKKIEDGKKQNKKCARLEKKRELSCVWVYQIVTNNHCNGEVRKVQAGDLLLRVNDMSCRDVPHDEIKRNMVELRETYAP